MSRFDELAPMFLFGFVACLFIVGIVRLVDWRHEHRAYECFARGGTADVCEVTMGESDISECMRAGGTLEPCKAAAL